MFFFFKQKTAYEMRISDWSSDVCSSDLTGLFTVEDQADAEATAAAAALAHQVEVARLEHAQPQRRAGQQDGVQREQGQGFGGHRRQANAARVGAAQKKRSIGGMDTVGAQWGATRFTGKTGRDPRAPKRKRSTSSQQCDNRF